LFHQALGLTGRVLEQAHVSEKKKPFLKIRFYRMVFKNGSRHGGLE
jgi:hypothetical protein